VGAFVWADSTDVTFSSVGINTFNVRASGGTRIYTSSDLSTGVGLNAGAGAWFTISDSTKKRNLRLVDTKEVLEKVASLPIRQWSYKSQDPSIEHIGPTAQDFWKLFHLGDDSLGISTIDPDGIALAAIQELKIRTDEIEQLKKELSDLRHLVEQMAAQQPERNQSKAASAVFTPNTSEQTLREIAQ